MHSTELPMTADEIIVRLSHLARTATSASLQLRALLLLMRHYGMLSPARTPRPAPTPVAAPKAPTPLPAQTRIPASTHVPAKVQTQPPPRRPDPHPSAPQASALFAAALPDHPQSMVPALNALLGAAT